MTRFAIDPATLVRLAEGNHHVSPDHRLVAPNSIRSLALDILLHRVRSEDLSERAALALHERMTEVKIRLLGDRVSRRTAWQFALKHACETTELAEYVAVATLQADVLVALNTELAAIAKGIVPLAPWTDLVEQ